MKSRLRHVLLLVAPLILSPLIRADNSAGFGDSCSQSDTHLDSDTWNLVTDCGPTTYCNANNTCAYRGCRKDIYPFGYNGVPFGELPPMCPAGQFCPDEGDQCLDQIAVGGTCQKDRDDECQFPPNYKELAGFLNVNGSICLNYTCHWANITLGQPCVIDNTAYTAYTDSGSEYVFVISRDNCGNGLYCDGSALVCMKAKTEGTACAGNKECLSYNCGNGKCDRAADQPVTPPAWQFVVVALGIVLLIVVTMVSLWFAHRKSRKENQLRLEQYYNEQVAYRQSIMTMSMAKNSLMSLPTDMPAHAARRSVFGDEDQAYSSAMDNQLIPPNMRRDSSATGWSIGGSDAHLIEPSLNGATSRRRQ